MKWMINFQKVQIFLLSKRDGLKSERGGLLEDMSLISERGGLLEDISLISERGGLLEDMSLISGILSSRSIQYDL